MKSACSTPRRTVQQDGLVLMRFHGDFKIKIYTTEADGAHLTPEQIREALDEVTRSIDSNDLPGLIAG